MHGLDDTNSFRARSIVGGRGDQRKGVVEMCDLRLVRSEQFSQLADRSAAPDGARSEPQTTHRIDRFVAQAVLRHLVPVRLEHGDLGRHALIFTAGLLVEVMRYQNVHRREFPIGTTSIMSKLQPRDERFRPKPSFMIRLQIYQVALPKGSSSVSVFQAFGLCDGRAPRSPVWRWNPSPSSSGLLPDVFSDAHPGGAAGRTLRTLPTAPPHRRRCPPGIHKRPPADPTQPRATRPGPR